MICWMIVVTVDQKKAPRTGCAGEFPAGSNRTEMEFGPADEGGLMIVR